MIKLRLRRMGAKKRPSYRIVAAESKNPRDGRFIEVVGFYDPLTDPATVRINEDRARHWLGHGAQPTPTVKDLLRRSGIITDSKLKIVITPVTATTAEDVVAEPVAASEKPAPRTRKPRAAAVEAPAAPA